MFLFRLCPAIYVPLLFNTWLKIQSVIFFKMCLVSNISCLSIKLLMIQSTVLFNMHLVIQVIVCIFRVRSSIPIPVGCSPADEMNYMPLSIFGK